MTSSVIEISPGQLAFASLFVLVAFAIMVAMRLHISRQYLIAAARGVAQVFALGFVLTWLFHLDSGLMVIAVLLFMSGVASMQTAKRVQSQHSRITPTIFGVLFFVCLLITFMVTGLIVRVEPWYMPQYVIPLGGMVLGNAMTGIAIALERLYRDLDMREDEIRGMIALGATPKEAAMPSIRAGVSAGLIPNINSLAAAGIVFIPGMMTGQILAGSTPLQAAPYQIVILLMISAADAIGSVIATNVLYRRRFNDEGAFVPIREEEVERSA